MKTYTICGSMKFAEDMKKIAYDLEISKGYKDIIYYNVFIVKIILFQLKMNF